MMEHGPEARSMGWECISTATVFDIKAISTRASKTDGV